MRSDGRIYVGKINRKATESAKKDIGKDYVVLKDAIELLTQHTANEIGEHQVRILPIWIVPHHGPVEITLSGAVTDASQGCETAFYAMIRGMTGTGVLLPGMG